MKRLLCYLKAIPFLLKSGVWCPHKYKEENKQKVIIIATDKGFRVSDNYEHNSNETVHPDATLVTSRCFCCGKEEYSWYVDFENIPVIKE